MGEHTLFEWVQIDAPQPYMERNVALRALR